MSASVSACTALLRCDNVSARPTVLKTRHDLVLDVNAFFFFHPINTHICTVYELNAYTKMYASDKMID